jgi:RNA polymerase sigma-70 factor (ECF subfamily)
MNLMQEGSEEAFEMVYNLTKKQVFFTIYAIMKDYGLSEELMQDTYIKIRQNISKYNLNTNAYAWIIRIARNLSINAYHKRKKELMTDEVENDFLFHSSCEDSMIDNMLLKKLLTTLPLEEREVIMLHTLGFKHREIAQKINKPLGTVLWLYNKAIKKLNKEVIQYEKE